MEVENGLFEQLVQRAIDSGISGTRMSMIMVERDQAEFVIRVRAGLIERGYDAIIMTSGPRVAATVGGVVCNREEVANIASTTIVILHYCEYLEVDAKIDIVNKGCTTLSVSFLWDLPVMGLFRVP